MLPPHAIRLSDLTGLITDSIRSVFEGQFFWVVGDVTSHSYKAKDDRHFFVLAEKDTVNNTLIAKVDAVAWKSAADKIRGFEQQTGQRFENGIQVLIAVSVAYSAAWGLKLTLHDIDSNFTIGALEQQKQHVLHKLLAECPDYIQKDGDDYVTRNNQIVFNAVIQKIAVVASGETAGYEDFVHTLTNNAYGYVFHLHHYAAPMQGENNAYLIKQAFIDVYNSRQQYDAIVLIRGGGAQTDLLVFDTFELGRVVAKFPIPIITGIGHQRNETVVDLLVHSPTKTPTKAAELIVAHNRRYEEEIEALQKQLVQLAQRMTTQERQQLQASIQAIKHRANSYLQQQNDRLGHYEALFALMNPDQILRLGFALVRHKGRIINSFERVTVNDEITVQLGTHEITATITTQRKYDGTAFDL